MVSRMNWQASLRAKVRPLFAVLLASVACTASRTVETQEASSADNRREARSAAPVPAPPVVERVVRAFRNGGLLSIRIPPGVQENRPAGEYGQLVLELAGSTVSLQALEVAPYDAVSLVARFGGTVVKQDSGPGHVAVVVAGTDRESEHGTFEVGGWVPGFMCRAVNVPAEGVDAVFDICSSIRREGGILESGVPRRVIEEPVLGMPSISIEDTQYVVQRIEAGKLSCDQILHELVLWKRESDVKIKTRTSKNGAMKVWRAPAGEEDRATQTEGFAVRGKYCCYFKTYPWVSEIPEDDVAALADVCDEAAADGWPESLLPEAGLR